MPSPSPPPSPQSGDHSAAEVSRLKRRIVALQHEVNEATGVHIKKAPCVLPMSCWNYLTLAGLPSLWDEAFAVSSPYLSPLTPLSPRQTIALKLKKTVLKFLSLIQKTKYWPRNRKINSSHSLSFLKNSLVLIAPTMGIPCLYASFPDSRLLSKIQQLIMRTSTSL